ncbi:uncharacterized protein LOC133911132 [Phragmites australis]|uniref:uncharacterized protein LOC133911132 n=1 Tax=Phragmites australis TaxID=29695 RepID=UPI002D77EE34|nr:uncharacterized protein LOC133911132 [Phragmites australis]
MAAPVEVGERGSIGSLVRREAEYFRKMEVDRQLHGHGKKSSKAAANGGSTQIKTTKKKGAGGGGFLPRMCSSAEVAEAAGSGLRERPARVRYRHLGAEGDSLHQH